MCTAKNHLDENETGEGTSELEDFLELPEMKDLEVLLESFEDQIYSEVFDGLMYEQVIYRYAIIVSFLKYR